MPRTVFETQRRRRRSPLSFILPLILIGIVGFLIFLGVRKNEHPTERIEQDVTNDVLAH